MVGVIKASSPGMKSMSADMFLDLPTMLAPSGEERTPNASAQVERAGLCLRRFSAAHSRVYGACAAEAKASETSLRAERGRLHSRVGGLSTVPRTSTLLISD